MSNASEHSYFWEIHNELPREGPGDNDSTRKAFSVLANLTKKPFVLDVACGPGMQTMELARLCNGDIVALDSHQEFLDELDRRAAAANVSERITTVNASMFELPFDDDSFDLIWCEGAIYIIGFEKGLTEWKPLLKKDGYLAVTHACYLNTDVPDQVRKFWEADSSGITVVEDNIATIASCGYELLDHFTLPKSAWMDNYYTPMESRLQSLRAKYGGNDEALKAIEENQNEIDMYKKYSDYYGYVFFIMQPR
jgi:SAM-dependent methyltransferase